MFRKLEVIKAPEADRNELKWLKWSLNTQNVTEDDLSEASNIGDSYQVFYSYDEEQADLAAEENLDGREDLNLGFYESDDETINRVKDRFIASYDQELSDEFEPAKKKHAK